MSTPLIRPANIRLASDLNQGVDQARLKEAEVELDRMLQSGLLQEGFSAIGKVRRQAWEKYPDIVTTGFVVTLGCFLQEEIPQYCKVFSPGAGGEFWLYNKCCEMTG